jgi:hypothetical protein
MRTLSQTGKSSMAFSLFCISCALKKICADLAILCKLTRKLSLKNLRLQVNPKMAGTAMGGSHLPRLFWFPRCRDEGKKRRKKLRLERR